MKLGNKGFAITGILYTVFVLFLMILLSVLSGLNIKRSLLEKNIENIKDSIEESCVEVSEVIDDDGFVAKYRGKYSIKINDVVYETYLSSGQMIYIEDSNLKTNNVSLEFLENAPSTIVSAEVVQICTTDKVW